MRVAFRYQRHIEGIQCMPGEHDLPDVLHDHWYFQAQVKEGVAQVIVPPVAKADAGEEGKGTDAVEGLKDESAAVPAEPKDGDDKKKRGNKKADAGEEK